MSPLTPCAAIIDTRNVQGQGRDLFGSWRMPTGASVRDTLRLYGFDAVEVYAGVATRANKKHSQKVATALQKNNDYARRLRADGVTVLQGRLVERSQKMEEKQVDVLLALQVADLVDEMAQLGAPFKHIVVLSEDMDLIPSYEFAAKRGFKVYAAAADTIHMRPQQKKWLLLHEEAAASLVELPLYATAAETRSYLAAVAQRSLEQKAVNWKAFRDQGAGEVRLYNGRGIEGTWTSPTSVKRGDRIQLHPDVVSMRERFPTLALDQAAPNPTPSTGFITATVTTWVNPARMKVNLDTGGSATLGVSPGAAQVGDQVLVHDDKQNSYTSRTFVGPLTRWQAPTGWTGGRTQEAVITGPGPGNKRLSAQTDAGDSIVVLSDRLEHATTGSRLIVALSGTDPLNGLPETLPLTCCLPQPPTR